MSGVLLESLQFWWPEVILSVGGLLVLLISAFSQGGQRGLVVAWLVLLASAVALWHVTAPPTSDLFHGLIVCDPLSLVFRWLALGTAIIVTLLLMGSRDVAATIRAESVGLLLLITVGLMVMAEADHLLMAYVGMELVSLGSYVLVGFLNDRRSAEGSLKYLLVGALSSGIMLFGMSLLFGLTGQLAFPDLLRATTGLAGPMASALFVSVTLILVGLGFKISMVPFHLWTPDAYEGAPIPVTAFLSVGPKAAGFALLMRFMAALSPAWPTLAPLVLGLTIITMTLGNLAALVQTNVKRLLAYSTIAQVGYLLIGFVVHTSQGLQGVLMYLVAYLFMNLGAFACVVAVADATGSESLDAFRGLAKRAPGLALMCTVFLLSLAGLPPLVGFLGKFLLFGAAIEAQQVGLALAGIINSAIALYYYVNIIRLMYVGAPGENAAVHPVLPLRLALGVCVVCTLGLGLYPGPLLSLLQGALSINLL